MGLCVAFIAFVMLPSLKIRTTHGALTDFLRMGLCVAFIAFVMLPSLKIRTTH
jgi:hypothetical protein